MSKLMSFTGLGLLAACLALSAPSVSQAQHHRHDHGGYGFRGYDGFGGNRGFGDYRGFRGHRDFGYNGHDGFGFRRPVIVHPEFRHWTPNRGWHNHGHIHVPHRGHYHTIPY